MVSALSRALAALVAFCTLASSALADIRGTQSTPAALRVTLKAEVDLSTQVMTVSEHGVPLYTWKISSGVSSRYPTPTGTFTPKRMHRMWHSRQWYGAPMPYAVFIHHGIAVHGTSYVAYLGRPASKGCVRLATPHAKLFFDLVAKHGKTATEVTISGDPNYRLAAVSGGRTGMRPRPKATSKPVVQETFGFGFTFGPSPATAPKSSNKVVTRKTKPSA